MNSSSKIEDPNSPDLKLLCVYTFDTLISYLTKKEIPNCFPNSLKNKKFPLFVTWTTGKQKNLRGCIGTFASNNLEKNLKKFALTAALQDDRFPPISEKEIKNLNCGISLLVNFEKQKIVGIGKLESMELIFNLSIIVQLSFLKFQLSIIWIKELLWKI